MTIRIPSINAIALSSFLVVLLGAEFINPEQSPASEPLGSGLEQQYFDKSVRPQDDLFRAVNGLWLEKTEIPADRSEYGVFGILAEKAEKDLREIIEECATAQDNPPGSEKQKIGDLYNSFMDEAAI